MGILMWHLDKRVIWKNIEPVLVWGFFFFLRLVWLVGLFVYIFRIVCFFRELRKGNFKNILNNSISFTC